MQITKLRIDGQFFYLEADQDTEAIKRDIIAAVTAGPQFIDFTAIGHGQVSVLMMPTLGARFETQERTEQELEAWAEDPPLVDFEAYGHE